MTPFYSSSQSGSPTELDIPAWDVVGRYLKEHQQVNASMREFWSCLGPAKRTFYAEVRGAFGHTIAFTYLRRSGRYADLGDLEALVHEVQEVLGTELLWDPCICDNRIDLYARTKHGFGLCVFTPWDSMEQLPLWVNTTS